MFLFYFLIGIGLLVVGWLALRWFAEANPRQIVTALRWAAGIVGGAVALWLVATGRLGQAVMLASVMAPLFVRWKALWTQMKNVRGPTPGSRSEVESGWFRMSLDHDTGAMDGLVLKGADRGRRLDELGEAALLALLAECRIDDPESAALLEAYLDRVHPEWRQREEAAAPGAGPATPSAAMTRDEAYRVLGLEKGASETEIRDAHRRLMKKLHPDHGGSSYLAAKINQAKDLLLGE
jgi:lipid-A-disaccharide synthase-like uncharacterized protein